MLVEVENEPLPTYTSMNSAINQDVKMKNVITVAMPPHDVAKDGDCL